MTPKAAFIASMQGLAADQAAILEQERALAVRRRRINDQMRKAIEAFAALDGHTAKEPASVMVDAEFAPRVPQVDKSKAEAGPAIAARRRYMTAVMEACRSVMLAVGHPMSVGEIMAVHPERARISAEAVMKAIDLRTRQNEPEFVGLRGFYWVSDKPLPEGWSHPKGYECAIAPESVSKGERARAKRQALIDSAEAKLNRKAAMLEEGWVPMRRVRRPGGVVAKSQRETSPDRPLNVKGIMTSLNIIRAYRNEPVVHFEAWPKTREEAQPYIDEVRAARKGRG